MRASGIAGRRRRLAIGVLGALVVLVGIAAPAQAAAGLAGDLDPSFGKGGVVLGPQGTSGGLLVQPDGKVVVSGQGADYQGILVRYLPDGTPDPGFGSGGTVALAGAFGPDRSLSTPTAAARQEDGKIVVAGYGLDATTQNSYDFALARFNADGSVDTTFGTAGLVLTNFTPAPPGGYGSYDLLNDVVVQSDGKIAAAGATGFQSFAVARYNSNGSLDTTFGSGGTVITPIGASASAQGLVALAGGELVAGGYATDASYHRDFALARYTSTGVLDTSFSGDGVTTTRVQRYGVDYYADIADLAFQESSGKIVVAGGAQNAQTYANDFVVGRYNDDGTLDTSFGTQGVMLTDFGTFSDRAHGVAIASDGKIVAAGTTGNAFALARYTPSGSADEGFGESGKVITRISLTADSAAAVQIQPDGGIVAAGTADAEYSSSTRLALARYLSSAPTDAGDLAVNAAYLPQPAHVGDRLDYRTSVTNNGPGRSLGITLTDLIPAAVDVEDVRSSQGVCTRVGRRELKCDLYGLLRGDTATVDLIVTPNETGGLRNSASADTTNDDPVFANNADSVAATIVPAEGAWSLTGSLAGPRAQGTATTLKDGRVLLVGGEAGSNEINGDAEIYDPAAGTWTKTDPLTTPRTEQTATLLPSGKVLVAGGSTDPYGYAFSSKIATAEQWDPATGHWSPAGDMQVPRLNANATLLENGKVLVTGGCCGSTFFPDAGDNFSANTTELYDPENNSWTKAAPMRWERELGTTTLLEGPACRSASRPSYCGKVLAVGGFRGILVGDFDPTGRSFGPPELYDPTTDSWSPTDDMSLERGGHTATSLPDGRVLVAGGDTCDYGCTTDTAEIYDPASGVWTSTPHSMVRPQAYAGDALLSNGKVLVAGGFGATPSPGAAPEILRAAQLYDPTDGSWSSAGVMSVPRAQLTATALPDGKVLIASGTDEAYTNTQFYSSAELYTPVSRPDPGGGSDTPAPSDGPAGGSGTPAPGDGPPAPGGTRPDTVAPVLTGYGLTDNPFVVGARSTATFGVAAAVTHKRGTAFKYTLSEAAGVRIVISRRRPGRRRAMRCVAPTRTLRHARRCTRVVGSGTLRRTSKQGANRVAFSGRIGVKGLEPGRYQAILIATDAANNRSKPKTILFRIVRR